jgi:hypothetical protein
MAKHYTLTPFETTEVKGDSIFFNNMITSGSVTITPDENFVVAASDFSVPNLPTNVASVIFTDTTTAGAEDNTVIGTVNFSSDIVADQDINIILTIKGDAKRFDDSLDQFTLTAVINDNTKENVFGSSSFTALSSYTSSTQTSNNVQTTTISASLVKNILTKIGELTVSADSGYHFKSKPYLLFENFNSKGFKLKTKTITTNSNNFITSYVFDVLVSISNTVNINNIKLEYEGILLRSNIKEITGFAIDGLKQISSRGEKKDIKIYGTPGAEVSVSVVKDSTGASLIQSSNFLSTTIITPNTAVQRVITKKIPETIGYNSVCRLPIRFPAGTGTYTISLFPKGETVLNRRVRSTYKISQLADPTITFTASTSNVNIRIDSGASFAFKGRPNAYPRTVPNMLSVQSIVVRATALGGHTFQTPTAVTWSSNNPSTSNWTNSVPTTNGRNFVQIDSISTTRANTNANLIVKYTVFIHRFGNTDVTMNLNLDNFITTA